MPVLTVRFSNKQLVPGDCCAVRVHQPGPLEAKAEKAIFLARDEKTSKGVWVLVTRNGIQQLTRARQTKLAASEEKWRLHKLEDKLVSSQGRVKETSAEVIDELPTLEERPNGPAEGHLLFGVQAGDGGMVAHAITNSTMNPGNDDLGRHDGDVANCAAADRHER